VLNCGKTRHWKNQCKNTLKNQDAKATKNFASTSRANDALICSLDSEEESWVLESEASFHVISQRVFFKNYVPIILGKEQSCGIVGKGTIKIKFNGSIWELKNVRHIHDMTKNLISIGQLANEGYTPIFHGDRWKISNNDYCSG